MSTRKESTKPDKDGGTRVPDTRDKKPYTAPHLTIYGAIEKLTKTGGQTTRDGGGGRKRH